MGRWREYLGALFDDPLPTVRVKPYWCPVCRKMTDHERTGPYAARLYVCQTCRVLREDPDLYFGTTDQL